MRPMTIPPDLNEVEPRSSRFSYWILAAITLWCFAIFFPAAAAAVGGGAVRWASGGAYQFFSRICHQADERSFHVFGAKLAVCARCTGVYVGFLIGGVLARAITNKSRSASPRILF